MSVGSANATCIAESALVQVIGVTKAYSTPTHEIRALKGVSLECRSGEILVVIGTNGSGKSTLLDIIGGVLSANDGEVYLAGRAIRATGRRGLAGLRGILYQQPARNLCLGFTIAEMVAVYRDGLQDATQFGALMNTLDTMGIAAARRVVSLSGGQQQLLALELVLARRPRLILLDEPTASLDVRNAMSVRARVQTARSNGVATIFVSHNLDEAIAIADRVMFMHDGAVVQIWTRELLVGLGTNGLREFVKTYAVPAAIVS